jgi:aspartyl-tRNA synthetase
MKQIAHIIVFASLLFSSCNSTPSKKEKTEAAENKIAVVDVDSILASPEKYIEKTVSIKGLVVHTCKHSGKKMFLAGTDKNKYVKVIAGPSISRFDQSLEGETVVSTGKLTLLDETQEKHEETGERKMKTAETSGKDTTTAGCVTETKIKNYQMVCDGFEVVNE